mgnify:CR=1 FL=1
MGFIQAVFAALLIFCSMNIWAIHECEVNFVRYLKGELPKDLNKNPMVNLWDERFNANLFLPQFRQLELEGRINLLEDLTKLIHKDKIYAQNVASLASRLRVENLVRKGDVTKLFLKRKYNHMSFYYSQSRHELTAQLFFDPEKLNFLNKTMANLDLSDFYRKEYRTALLQSNRNVDEIELAFESGMSFRQDMRSLEQFKAYLEFLDNAKPRTVKKGLQRIENIYDFNYRHGLSPIDTYKSPDKHFLSQQSRLKDFEKRRVSELQRTYKLHQDNGVNAEIDKLAEKEANGFFVRIAEKLRLKRKINESELPEALRKRAVSQARHEKKIYQKLLNGCNSGSSQRLAGAKKKFSRFKFFLALGVAPVLYVKNNQERMKTDPYFWEKIGHEMLMSILFTYVGNKLFTNTSTTFLKKYIEGYIKFGVLSYIEAVSYDELFGDKSLIRYFQQLYKGELPPSKIEAEFEKLKNDPEFEKKVKELLAYLDEQSKKQNTKNTLDKYFNLSAYSSLDDDVRITREDLESEEAREMMMELIAERLYLENMGDWALFQTGNRGNDRFAFFRARNIIWDLKGLAINLAIFDIMCREPFGKIGSWAAILSIIMGDQLLLGDVTYRYRSEAINQ